jgi:hypothetical protein
MKRIIQIIQSEGWFAVYGERNQENEIVRVSVIDRLISFALVDQNGITSVEGVDSGDTGIDDLSPESDDFLRYVHEHDAAYAELMYLYRQTVAGVDTTLPDPGR